MSFMTETARWRALTIRDATANGHFVYSVKSTNIYCRPTCPARLARRANVGFYKTAAEAEAAGFRACKRCKPDADKVADPQEEAVKKACALIEEALDQNEQKSFRLQDLAQNVGLTSRYFHKIFKDKTGLTPKQYAKAKAQERLPASASAAVSTEQSPLDSWDFGDFDFNDLVDLDVDPNLSLNPTTPPDALGPVSSNWFGKVVDVNMQPSIWNENLDPNVLFPDLNTADDKQFPGLGATLPTVFATQCTSGIDEWSRLTVTGPELDALDAVLNAITNAPPIDLPLPTADIAGVVM